MKVLQSEKGYGGEKFIKEFPAVVVEERENLIKPARPLGGQSAVSQAAEKHALHCSKH